MTSLEVLLLNSNSFECAEQPQVGRPIVFPETPPTLAPNLPCESEPNQPPCSDDDDDDDDGNNNSTTSTPTLVPCEQVDLTQQPGCSDDNNNNSTPTILCEDDPTQPGCSRNNSSSGLPEEDGVVRQPLGDAPVVGRLGTGGVVVPPMAIPAMNFPDRPPDDGDGDGDGDGDPSGEPSTPQHGDVPQPDGGGESSPTQVPSTTPFIPLEYPGMFSLEFASLVNLQVLNLANNPLGEEGNRKCMLSSHIGYLPRSLQQLNLDNTYIAGSSLPSEIGLLSNLRQIRTPLLSSRGGNFSLGRIPSEFGQLRQLVTLFDEQTLESTTEAYTLPTEIGQMTSLQRLDFRNVSSVKGTLPSEIGGMSDLVLLDFWNTRLEGSIPTEVGLLTELTYLRFKLSPGVTGTLPTELGQLENLRRLDVQKTQVDGTLPSEFGLLTKLTYLDVGGTNLTGKIPTELNMLSNNMKYTGLLETDLEGSIEELVGCQDDEREGYGSVMVDKVECSCCQEKCEPAPANNSTTEVTYLCSSTVPPEIAFGDDCGRGYY